MGFTQGLSGLRASSTSLDVIGNNIANASTVGFKMAQAQFADLYANSMHTVSANQVGIGVSVTRVQQQFTQGNVTPSANALDVAINGNGFFRFSDNGSIVYSRNGQLELTKDGYLVNAAGHRLTGYNVDATGVIQAGAALPIQISNEDIAPNITTNITSLLNLDSRDEMVDTASHPFDVNDPLSYNSATAIDVYDSLGNMHVLQTYYVRISNDSPSQWAVYGYTDGTYVDATGSTTEAGKVGIDRAATAEVLGSDAKISQDTDPMAPNYDTGVPAGTVLDPGTAANGYRPAQAAATYDIHPLGILEFDPYGKPTAGSDTIMSVTIPGINGAADMTPTIDFKGTTQYGSTFSVNDNQQDGYSSGRLTGFSMDEFGYIQGRYTNGETRALGQVVLTYFKNPNGLGAIGDNEWIETTASGAPVTGTPLSGPLGALKSYAIEESNVDLTEELVNMITAQRVYQANAQTIKTEDQIMNTLVNLR